MKNRTFIVTFLLFLSIFFTSLFFISTFFFHIQVESAMERGENDHYLIANSMRNELKSLMNRGADKEEAIQYLFQYYSGHYAKQKGYLEIFKNNKMIYSNFPSGLHGTLFFDNEGDNRISVLKRLEEKDYVIVIGNFPQTNWDYKIQYILDATPMIGMWERLRNILLGIGVVFSVLSGALLMFFLELIFRPFSQVVAASKDIANGNYKKRIQGSGTGELAVMAESFNDMAGKVEEAVTVLSREAKQKQQFVDNFSHEIRTPLTSVYGFAEYMQKSMLSEEERITICGYIIEDSKYILSIADRLLELATLNNRNIVKNKCRTEEVFYGAAKLLHKRLNIKGVQLTWENAQDFLYGDGELLQSLLVNLTNNAIDASPAGGRIHWRAYRDGDHAVLSVSDHGIGIPEDQLDKINEPFYRVDKSRNREFGNAGLGLAICRQIAECHEAKIIFESRPQKGTTVKVMFTLP